MKKADACVHKYPKAIKITTNIVKPTMPRKPLSASHRAKIAAGVRQYHAQCRKHRKKPPKSKPRSSKPPRRRAILMPVARPMRSKLGNAAGKRRPTKGVKTYLSALARIQAWAPTASKKVVFTT